ncbi:cohesin domain-containing protein [Patescibacteria group bacterium]
MYRFARVFLISVCCVCMFAVLSNQAWAGIVSFNPSSSSIGVGDPIDIDINISGLEIDNLATFDFNINYDDTVLNFVDYALGSELGDISIGDADDWSLGNLGGGVINLTEESWLWDFDLQPDSFTLATVSFTGNSIGISPLSFSNVILGDDWGDPLSATLERGSVNVVPIPSTCLLLLFGLVGMVGIKRKVLIG